MPNRLAQESSPYLLQHANNPVDWRPWGAEALELSQSTQRPIFLSIGYSACHWCHVMEHESFEDAEIAAYLNEHFVCIKVDREERPDLDQIYMNAVQLLTGRGGWPMSMFLTPELHPFFGGTYWPPRDGRGMPGFLRVLHAVVDAWTNRREQAVEQAKQLTAELGRLGQAEKSETVAGESILHAAEVNLERSFDFAHGGFGGAPKFPHPMHLQFLLRQWHRHRKDATLNLVRLGLDKMAHGGIYDHLGGGFARYSVDERWLVPHFEKMLYDNALLAGAYLDGFLATGDPLYARIVRETCNYVLRDMTDPAGGFYSSEDADSEGVEGKFYVWTRSEIDSLLGAAADRFAYVYDITDGGNFEHGLSILNMPHTLAQAMKLKGWNAGEMESELAASRAKLLAVRNQRVRPGRDDKVLVGWNGLMLDSLSRAGAVLGESRYVEAARKAGEFLTTQLRRADGRLLHSWRAGQARFDAYLDDYAALANALVSLYEATFEERWIDEAVRLADLVLRHFRDLENGGFYFTAHDHERLIARTHDIHDSAAPGGSSLAATVLIRLGKLCGRTDYLAAARETLDASAALMERAPLSCGQMLVALDMELGPFHEVVLLGDVREWATAEVLANLRGRYIPNRVVACRAAADDPHGSPEIDPIFVGKHASSGTPAAFVCADFTCHTPAPHKSAILAAWERLEKPERPTG